MYTLAAVSDEPVRVPFDNGAFDPVRASRGNFDVEDDGSIDLGSTSPGRSTLAR